MDRYGFNAGLTAPGNLTKGYDSISQDFPTIVWRLKELGFNAIRLPFSFSHFLVRSLHMRPEPRFNLFQLTELALEVSPSLLSSMHSHGMQCSSKESCTVGCMLCAAMCMQDVPAEYTRNCTVASDYEVRRSMVPRILPKLPVSKYGLPNDDAPQVPGHICNIAMPGQSTRSRYLWVRPPFAQAVHRVSFCPPDMTSYDSPYVATHERVKQLPKLTGSPSQLLGC